MGIATRHKAEIRYLVNREIRMMKGAKRTKEWGKLFSVNGKA